RRVVFTDWHWLRPLEELGHLFAFAELDVGLFPVRPLTSVAPLPLDLAVRDVGANAGDFRAQQLFDRALDLDLVGVRRDLEHDRASVLAQNRRLLGDQGTTNDVGLFHVILAGFGLSALGFGPVWALPKAQ